MGTFSRTILIGRLGRDPELRHTADQRPVATLSLATRRLTPAGAEPQSDWHRVVCWGELAAFAAQHLAKGRLVYVGGRLEYRVREGRAGERHRSVDVVAAELVPLDRRPAGEPTDADAEAPDTTG